MDTEDGDSCNNLLFLMTLPSLRSSGTSGVVGVSDFAGDIALELRSERVILSLYL